MTEEKKEEIAVVEINEEFMKKKLYEFRGCKVLLDADLAEVYGYELKAWVCQVKCVSSFLHLFPQLSAV